MTAVTSEWDDDPAEWVRRQWRRSPAWLRHGAALGATIATANVDDFPMQDVLVEHWPVGG